MTDDLARRHEWRRLTQFLQHPRHMLRLQQMRRQQSATGYSLQQFEQTRSIFIHIPKASGVSIARSLYGNLAGGHMPMRDYELAFGSAFLKNSFVFTFVRNPWDRLYSAFRFLAKGGMNRADAEWLKFNRVYMSDFEHFVLDGLANPRVANSIHMIPQEQYLYSLNYEYRQIGFVGFFENIQNDFESVCKHMQKPKISLSHSNKTSDESVDYRSAYTDRMRATVGRFYRRDVELFGYDFDGQNLSEQIARRDAGLLFKA